MARQLARACPDELTTEQRKDRRGDRIYLDVMRNAHGQTAVMPYAVRALPGAPVATPLDLDELDDARLDPRRWHIGNIRRRLGQKDDPWSDIGRHGVTVERARRSLDDDGGGG
jgi:bifunctional non-homologous end joining protein LigD